MKVISTYILRILVLHRWASAELLRNHVILHTFLSALACTACTDMVYSKELERDVTTSVMAKVILRLKTLVFIPS